MRCERADSTHGRVIMHDIWEGICKAKVIIADLTAGNPNVAYEVGMANVLGKDIIFLSQSTHVPFDFLGNRLIVYENTVAGVNRLTEALREKLPARRRARRRTAVT